MKKLMLIVNPNAGKGKYKSALGEALKVFYDGGYLTEVYFTQKPKDATALALEHAARYDLIVCMGGDGTLSEVTAGLTLVPDSPELGYIPMGTANDVAATLSIPKNAVEAAELVLNGRGVPLDIGLINGQDYFTYIAAFGAFTEVSYLTPQPYKQALGHLAYVLSGMTLVPKISGIHAVVEHDNGVLEGDFVFGGVTNSTSLAGLVKLDSDLVELSDGLFEVIMVDMPKNFVDLQDAFQQYLSKNYTEHINIIHSKKVRFTFENPIAWTRDGENGGEHSEITLENLKHAVNIRVNPESCGKLFLTEFAQETLSQSIEK